MGVDAKGGDGDCEYGVVDLGEFEVDGLRGSC